MTSSVAPPQGAQINGKQANPPNQTLYCTNLPDKLQKEDLRRSLYTIFSTYGPVLDVVALKTIKMRGQAHIVFRDVQTSSRAMRELQGFDFFGKKMKISYAKGKSNTISKLDGSSKPLETKTGTKASELQKSIFNAPPKAEALKATSNTLIPLDGPLEHDAKSPQGVKRQRDESDDASMDEDDDAMEESDDD